MKFTLTVKKEDVDYAKQRPLTNPVEVALKRHFHNLTESYAEGFTMYIRIVGGSEYKGKSPDKMREFLMKYYEGELPEDFTETSFEIELTKQENKVNEKMLNEFLNL